MGWPLLARCIAVGACLTGCAALAGINDGAEGSSDGGAPSGESGVVDTGTSASDAPGGDTGCVRRDASESPSLIHAQHLVASAPVMIDGKSDEWGCVDRLSFTVGQRVLGEGTGIGIAQIGVQWDENVLYILGEVTTQAPTSDAGRQQNFQNDSLSIFLAGPTPGATYTANDHHIVIDSIGQVADYMITARTGLAGITGAAGSVSTAANLLHFVVEARVDASILGRTKFAMNDLVRINFQVNDGPSSGTHYRVWFLDKSVCQKITGTCDVQGTSEPYCDPRCTGSVILR